MSTELISRLAEEAGFEMLSVGPATPHISRIRGEHTREAVTKLCALVAEECARQAERSTCADQAAAHIRALFPPAP